MAGGETPGAGGFESHPRLQPFQAVTSKPRAEFSFLPTNLLTKLPPLDSVLLFRTTARRRRDTACAAPVSACCERCTQCFIVVSGLLLAVPNIIRIHRFMGFRRRMFCEFIQRKTHGLLQLRIVAFAHRLRFHIHFVVRLYTVVLHVPLALGIKKSKAWGRDVAAIHQGRDAADPYQSSP